MVTEKISGKRRLVKSREKDIDENVLVVGDAASRADRLEGRTRRWGTCRNNDTRTVKNEFGPLAPLFFYQLVAAFMTCKEKSALWSMGNGARLMSKFILTLACCVQCSGYHPSTHVLAHDLFSIIWEFHNADSPIVRQAVLVGVATCIMFLSADDLIKIVLDTDDISSFLIDSIITDSSNDDEQCKQLALYVLTRIKEVSEELMCLT